MEELVETANFNFLISHNPPLTKLKKAMEKQIEKAIRETLVISNPQSIHLAVKKILLLLDDTKKSYNHANNKHKQ